VIEFKPITYHRLGPWRNHWGYTTEIAQFDEDDIIMKVTTPTKSLIIKRFSSWEDCECAIMLVEEDRRF
jgi:environmental stress-induced protein Ves